MLTGYCLRAAVCARCHGVADLAMVQATAAMLLKSFLAEDDSSGGVEVPS
jgi:hypothetical protein